MVGVSVWNLLPLPFVALSLLGSSPEEKDGRTQLPARLPSGFVLQEKGTQEYRVSCDYLQTDDKDRFLGKDRITARFTRGREPNTVSWTDVRLSRGKEIDGEPATSESLAYMEGFEYDPAVRWMMFLPGFFRGFPATATASYAKNLVWDFHMIEDFGQGYFEKLELNRPHAPASMTDAGVPLAGVGMFRNRKVELTWIGVSEKNGESCALIRYQAFFNRFEMGVGRSQTSGLTHYWGEIWVSLEDKQIEYATLYEHVSLRIGPPKGEKTPYRVFRVGAFERL